MAGLYVNASCGIGSLPPCNDTGILIDGYMAGVARHIKNFRSHSTFYEQAASGTLPAFSWLSPSWQSCDHPCNDMAKGERQLKDAYEALCAGPVGPPAALPSCAKQNSPALSWLASEFCLRRLRRSTLGCWRRLSACEQSTRRAVMLPSAAASCLFVSRARVSSCLVLRRPHWNTTMFLLVYDDIGGYFDPVPSLGPVQRDLSTLFSRP